MTRSGCRGGLAESRPGVGVPIAGPTARWTSGIGVANRSRLSGAWTWTSAGSLRWMCLCLVVRLRPCGRSRESRALSTQPGPARSLRRASSHHKFSTFSPSIYIFPEPCQRQPRRREQGRPCLPGRICSRPRSKASSIPDFSGPVPDSRGPPL